MARHRHLSQAVLERLRKRRFTDSSVAATAACFGALLIFGDQSRRDVEPERVKSVHAGGTIDGSVSECSRARTGFDGIRRPRLRRVRAVLPYPLVDVNGAANSSVPHSRGRGSPSHEQVEFELCALGGRPRSGWSSTAAHGLARRFGEHVLLPRGRARPSKSTRLETVQSRSRHIGQGSISSPSRAPRGPSP